MFTNAPPNRLEKTLIRLGLLALLLGALVAAPGASQTAGESQAAAAGGMPEYDGPRYDDQGRLLLPENFRRWVFVGASLGVSYSEGGGGTEMFHETLMEPSAYAHFAATGEFREGTMLALLLHEAGESALPQRRGRFAGPLATVEMAVKDSARSERSWEYYGFGSRDGLRREARRIGSDGCYDCHRTEAAHDNVFLQFYPLLAEQAPAGTVFTTGAGERRGPAVAAAARTEGSAEPAAHPLALGGLDPVLLVDGRRELGKAEIEMLQGGFAYRFVSEPTRARFEAEPERYSFSNETCLVVPGATVDPSLFSVYEGRLYAFATENCVADFEAEPERYLAPDAGGEEADGGATP